MPALEKLFRVRIGSKGQVVIPKSIREAYNIGKDGEILMIPLKEGILLKPTKGTLRLRGLLKGLNANVTECEAILAEAKKALLKGCG
ncbi:TPA: AbrB/MazE/SpoVT family DNA-binding domain-containing protein [Candidatus Bathyarchaeota archaeon]|nr:AbrB/MazE/SpoVT family DNA-binding domain-containing protein [Candidatus Bathyarchaeota archaeon]